jgi:hypothetical protein
MQPGFGQVFVLSVNETTARSWLKGARTEDSPQAGNAVKLSGKVPAGMTP